MKESSSVTFPTVDDAVMSHGLVYLSKKMHIGLLHHEMDTKEWLERDARQSHDGRWVLKSNGDGSASIFKMQKLQYTLC